MAKNPTPEKESTVEEAAAGAAESGARRDEAPYKLFGPKGNDVLAEVKPAEKLLRIRALLAQWMRMENLVVLAASGCSCGEYIGGKTLRVLEESVIGVLQGRYDANKKDDLVLRRIVDARASQVGAEGAQSFESWLTHVSSTEHLLESAGSPINTISWQTAADGVVNLDAKTARRLLLDIEHAIYGFCALKLPPIEEEVTGHHAFFAKLIGRDPSLGRAHIFTTNYDTVIEQALDQLRILFFDGFGGKTETKFDPSVYGLDVYYPGEVSAGRVRRYDKFLHLYKLHGSIHWYQAPDGTVCSAHEGLDDFVTWHELKTDQERASQLDTLWPTDRRIAILPTANKFVQTLDLPFSHLFRAFHQRLHIPQTFFVVVGYGFSDDHINEIIDSAMTNPSLIMLIVDPSPTDRLRDKLRRYQNIGERVFLLCPAVDGSKYATFDDFAINLMPQVQWLDDYVKLRRYEKTVGDGPAGDALLASARSEEAGI
jgi:SIR2-like domain